MYVCEGGFAFEKKTRHNGALFFKAAVLAFAVFSIVSLVRLQSENAQKRLERDALLQQISQCEQNVNELKALLAQGSHDDIIERAAREKLGYVFADEQIYTDVGR